MQGRQLTMLLVLAVGLTGCLSLAQHGTPAPPMTPPMPTARPAAPPTAAPKPPSSPPPAAITGSKLTVTLTSSQGKKAQVYLFAPDEAVRVEDAASCMAQVGDRFSTGRYDAYLLAPGASGPVRQNLVLFGGEALQFNERRPEYLTVLPGEQGQAPDVLLLRQYGSCNGTGAMALALSPDGGQLIPYNFVSKRISLTAGIGSMDQPGPGKLRTKSYNNATGIHTTTMWEVREAEKALVATNVEETQHP